MFYEDKVQVLDCNLVRLKDKVVDLQPYDKIIKFDDEIDIEIDTRMFADNDKDINDKNYVRYGDNILKIMTIKRYSDYVEVQLYTLESEVWY